jgi:hypothetical protein
VGGWGWCRLQLLPCGQLSRVIRTPSSYLKFVSTNISLLPVDLST